MKKALAAVLLLLPAACTDQPPAATWQQPPPAKPAVSALPSGLIAVDRDDSRLRVHDAETGAVLRELSIPAGTPVAYSPDFRYAARVDRGAGLLTVYTLVRDSYEVSATLTAASLGGEGLALVDAGFAPRTGRLGVELDGGDGGMHKSVGIDPGNPGVLLPGFPSQLTDSYGEVAEPEHVAIPTLPEARDVTVRRTARELVDAGVVAPDDDGDGVSALLYTCHGRQLDAFTLACYGQGKRAELVALTATPDTAHATIRAIGELTGKPFRDVFVSPDGTRLIAARADGFYTVPAAGGTPRRLFGPLPGTVTGWN